MKIIVENYNPQWPETFQKIKKELEHTLKSLQPVVAHIGSTSIPQLMAKPIIDIAVGLQSLEDLDKSIQAMIDNNYIYYEVYNQVMPERRFFLGLKEAYKEKKAQSIYTAQDPLPHLHAFTCCNIHIWKYKSEEWTRHLAFKQYLMQHPETKEAYGALKKTLSQREWNNSAEYNQAKNAFIKREEQKAILWYNNNK